MAEPIEQMDILLGVDQVINRAQITVYPVETVGAVMTLWTAHAVLRLAPGQEHVVYAPFRDENGERVGAVDVIDPVATTDYTVNDQPDGTGFNYTNSPHFSLSVEIEATRAKIVLENTAIGPLYMTKLQIRGKPIRVYDPIVIEEEDAASQSSYEVRVARLDLPMQPDPGFAKTYGEYLVGRFKTPFMWADRVTIRDRDVIGRINVFSLDVMDKVIVSDHESGVSSLQHWIRGVEYDLSPGGFVAALHLERADDRRYWLLQKPGYGELGSATRLGF